jgi:3-oxoadipate enol-lactonase
MDNLEKEIKLSETNLTVSYNDTGKNEAPDIVFIHGFPLNKSMWDQQVNVLKENFRVISYDIRGHGKSEGGDEYFSIELFVKDLIILMDALKIKKAILCGLSMGGYIALNAIENYPDRFSALVLCDTNCAADSKKGKEKRMKTIEEIRAEGVNYYAEMILPNLFAPGSFITIKQEIGWVREMIINTSKDTLISTLLALYKRKETCSKLSGIKVPALIMVGKEDKLTPPEAARNMQKKIKGSLLEIIEHAGHLSNLENPAVFNRHILKFLNTERK